MAGNDGFFDDNMHMQDVIFEYIKYYFFSFNAFIYLLRNAAL